MAEKNFLDNNGLLYFWTKIKEKFVQKDGNKVLSDNNYTTEEKNKLAGLNNYTLPTASATTLGGVKVGAGLEINSGVLSATGGGTADSVDWSNVQNKPNTVAGYGITDANISGQVVKIGSNSVTVPSNTNELTNGAGYQTAGQVSSAISNATADFVTEEDVSDAVSSAVADKVTTTQMNSAIDAATENLATNTSVTSAINSAITDMATKTYVTQQLANINKKTVVTSTTQMTDANTIYLMANEGSGNNIYDEYIVVSGKPEKVGTTEVDLTNYVQESDLVAITNGEIDDILAS